MRLRFTSSVASRTTALLERRVRTLSFLYLRGCGMFTEDVSVLAVLTALAAAVALGVGSNAKGNPNVVERATGKIAGIVAVVGGGKYDAGRMAATSVGPRTLGGGDVVTREAGASALVCAALPDGASIVYACTQWRHIPLPL